MGEVAALRADGEGHCPAPAVSGIFAVGFMHRGWPLTVGAVFDRPPCCSLCPVWRAVRYEGVTNASGGCLSFFGKKGRKEPIWEEAFYKAASSQNPPPWQLKQPVSYTRVSRLEGRWSDTFAHRRPLPLLRRKPILCIRGTHGCSPATGLPERIRAGPSPPRCPHRGTSPKGRGKGRSPD